MRREADRSRTASPRSSPSPDPRRDGRSTPSAPAASASSSLADAGRSAGPSPSRERSRRRRRCRARGRRALGRGGGSGRCPYAWAAGAPSYGGAAGERVHEQRGERVQVAGRLEGLASKLLGRAVADLATLPPTRRRARAAPPATPNPSRSTVCPPREAGPREALVNQAMRVGEVQRVRTRAPTAQHLASGERGASASRSAKVVSGYLPMAR